MFKKANQQQLLSGLHKFSKLSVSAKRLNLFGKGLVIIDTVLPSEDGAFDSVTEIDLSHNAITTLIDMQQFQNVEFVNLAQNKIMNPKQLQRLYHLKKLQKLFIKGNPFLKQPLPRVIQKFLWSLETDVEFVSKEIKQQFQSFSKISLQLMCFENYLHKIQMHSQLYNQFSMSSGFTSDFPFLRLQKIFTQFYKDIYDPKQIIQQIPEQYFQANRLGIYLQSKTQQLERKRIDIIKRIHAKQELLQTQKSKAADKKLKKPTIAHHLALFSNLKEINDGNLSKDTKTNKYVLKLAGSPDRKTCLNKDDDIQANFFSSLLKINPVYHLLHSPLPSLKSNEKDLLINRLLVDLKEKSAQNRRLQVLNEQLLETERQLKESIQRKTTQNLKLEAANASLQYQLRNLSDSSLNQSQKKTLLYEQVSFLSRQLEKQKSAAAQLIKNSVLLKQALSVYEEIDERQQKIKVLHNKRLLIQYYRLIQDSARKHYIFAQHQEGYRQIESLRAQKHAFDVLKQNAYIQTNFKLLKRIIVKKGFKQMNLNIKSAIKLKQTMIYALKYIFNRKCKRYLKIFQEYIARQQAISFQIKIFRNKAQKLIKRKVFSYLEYLLNQKHEKASLEVSQAFRIQFLMKACFRQWLVVIKKYYYHEAQLIVKLKDSKKLMFFDCLAMFYYKKQELKGEAMGLQLFLEKYHRIFYFHLLAKSIRGSLFNRELKGNKIYIAKRHRYFNFFQATMRDRRIAKLIKIKQIKMAQQEMQAKKMKQLEIKRLSIKNNRVRFRNLLRKTYILKLKQILQRDSKWLQLFQQKLYKYAKRLFRTLHQRNFVKTQVTIKSKALLTLLDYKRRLRGPLAFIKALGQANKQKRKLEEQIASDKRRIMNRYFIQWKINVLVDKLQYLQDKLYEIGPQIEDISQRQRETNSQKILMMRQLEEKNDLLRGYEKKIIQYDYLLESKELKYEKLKNLYADAVKETDYDYFPERNKEIRITRDNSKYQYSKFLDMEEKNINTFKLF